MLRDYFRGLFSFSRRRKRKANERVEDNPGILPPIRLPNEPGGVTIHVHALRATRSQRDQAKSTDIFDYLLGLLIIGLLVLGGTLWSSRNGPSTDSNGGGQSLSPPSWMRRDSPSGNAAPSSFSSRALQTPKSKVPAGGSDTAEDLPVADTLPSPIRIVPAFYTDEARNAGFHGKVFVSVFVDPLGVPEKVEATSPIPFGLELPIRQAILQWRFQPALTRGVAVMSKTVVEVPFR